MIDINEMRIYLVLKNSILIVLILITLYLILVLDSYDEKLDYMSEGDRAEFENEKRILQVKHKCTRILRATRVKYLRFQITGVDSKGDSCHSLTCYWLIS